jgi:hypothetical protein
MNGSIIADHYTNLASDGANEDRIIDAHWQPKNPGIFAHRY